VADGKAAVEAVAQEDFDLILMDVQMPEVDGLEATRSIRRLGRERGRNIPVVGMTAHAMPGDRERCLAAGMDDYVAKPIKPELFYAVVERYLEGDGSARPVRSHARKTNSVFERNLKGNQTLVVDLARDFLQDYPETLNQLKNNIAQGRCRDLEFLAHNLKSVVGFFNAEDAYRLARQLETAAHEERLDMAGEILGRLENALVEIREELSTLCRQAG
jgi:CheY-like chemotaxis protein